MWIPLHKIVVCCQQKSTGTARRIVNCLAWLGTNALHDDLNKRTWCEILSCSALGILGILLQEPLIRIPLYICEADFGMDLFVLSPAPYFIDFQLEAPDGTRGGIWRRSSPATRFCC